MLRSMLLLLSMIVISVLALAFGACAPVAPPPSTPESEPGVPTTEPGISPPESGAPPSKPGVSPPEPEVPPSEPEVPSESVSQETKMPELSDALKRNCQRSGPSGGFDNAGLDVGEMAVDFTLKDTQGNTVRLAELLSQKPVMMVFGSFT